MEYRNGHTKYSVLLGQYLMWLYLWRCNTPKLLILKYGAVADENALTDFVAAPLPARDDRQNDTAAQPYNETIHHNGNAGRLGLWRT